MKGILYRSCHGDTDRKSGGHGGELLGSGRYDFGSPWSRRMIGSKDCREPVFVLMARGLRGD